MKTSISLLAACVGLWLGFFLFSAKCLSAQQSPVSDVPTLAAPVTIPFEKTALPTTLIYVNIRLNGKGPYPFMLDTGAPVCMVEPDLATEAGLTPVREVAIGTGGAGRVAAELANCGEMRMGGMTCRDMPFIVVANPAQPRFRGVIGLICLRPYVITLDYAHQTLTLADSRTFRYAGKGKAVPLVFDPKSHLFAVQGSVDGLKGLFLLDTGNDEALMLHGGFVAAQQLTKKYRPLFANDGRNSILGVQQTVMTRVKSLQFGAITVPHPLTDLMLDPQNSEAQFIGNIGQEILEQFIVTFDYPRRIAYFEPNARYGKRIPYDRTGMRLYYAAGETRIREIIAGGAAEKAGLRVGDIVFDLNGKPVKKMPMPLYRQATRQPVGTRLRFRVQSGKKTRSVALILKDVL